MGPLKDLLVIDLTRVLAGPWCTQILGDLGARVIKIEHPDGGDDTRKWGPPWLKDKNGNATDDAAYFCSANRSKYSVTINLKTEDGIAILKKLVTKADIFIENFKVGGLAKMGLDYTSLAKINPLLIYLSITGFGQTGPMANQPGYDYLIQGLGGLMSITGPAENTPGDMPQRVGVPIVDINAGLYATIGILSALHHRCQTNHGQYIDLALLDSQVSWLANQAANYLIGGQVPGRSGNQHPNLVPYQPFATSNGDIIIAVGNDRQFKTLCQRIGLATIADDQRYLTNADRIENRLTLIDVIATEIIKQPAEFWLNTLPVAGVPCSVINNIEQAFNQPQITARGMKIDLPHALAGTVPGVANPLKFSKTEIEYTQAPPIHGADTKDVLSDILGYSVAELESLKTAGVI